MQWGSSIASMHPAPAPRQVRCWGTVHHGGHTRRGQGACGTHHRALVVQGEIITG